MGHHSYTKCIDNDFRTLVSLYPEKFSNFEDAKANIEIGEYLFWMKHNFHLSAFPLMANESAYCNYEEILASSAQGTGLAFVVFTEAILQFPLPPLWAVLFFLMLLMLGLGSMFGTLEGVITSLNDSQVIKVKKPVLTAVLCGSACVIGLIFTFQSGQYWVSLFDHFAGSYALMCVAFFEIVAVIYVYGYRRFINDIEFMTDVRVGLYWTITWRYISPTIMLILFISSIVKSFSHLPTYSAYDAVTTNQVDTEYPAWALFIALLLVAVAMGPVPFIWFVRKFKIWKVEGDIPAASKCLGATASTTYMLKSEPSFNRMVESTASELQSAGIEEQPKNTHRLDVNHKHKKSNGTSRNGAH